MAPTLDQYQPMTFRPTIDELTSFVDYVSYMEKQCAHKAGVAKIIPPKSWVARKAGYDSGKLNTKMGSLIAHNISDAVRVPGCFMTEPDLSGTSVTLAAYQQLAVTAKHLPPKHTCYNELEQIYWKAESLPAFTAEVQGTLTDSDQEVLNLAFLPNILTGFRDEDELPDACLPRLSVGMWKATSCWQVEDMDLFALKYLHFGKPVTHYCVPPEFGFKLEQLAQKLFPDMTKDCFNFLRHKNLMINPKILLANDIPVHKLVQEQGSFLVFFPHAYHASFTHGFNIAEGVNFGNQRWVEYGKRFRECLCNKQPKAVKINMSKFVKKFQPEKYTLWKEGNDMDLHPEDPKFIRSYWDHMRVRLMTSWITNDELDKLKENLKLKREVVEWFRLKFPHLDYIDQYELAEVKGVSEDLKTPVKSIGDENGNMEKGKEKHHQRNLEHHDQHKEFQWNTSNDRKNQSDLNSKKSQFKCPSNKVHRKAQCKQCAGCKTPDCNKCIYCLDKPKNGGKLVLKKKCKERECENPIMGTCPLCK